LERCAGAGPVEVAAACAADPAGRYDRIGCGLAFPRVGLRVTVLPARREIASEGPPLAACGPKFVRSDVPVEPAPVWRIVSGPESHNFNYPPAAPGDPLPPLPSLPEEFGVFS
jgi:hypothetical protein